MGEQLGRRALDGCSDMREGLEHHGVPPAWLFLGTPGSRRCGAKGASHVGADHALGLWIIEAGEDVVANVMICEAWAAMEWIDDDEQVTAVRPFTNKSVELLAGRPHVAAAAAWVVVMPCSGDRSTA